MQILLAIEIPKFQQSLESKATEAPEWTKFTQDAGPFLELLKATAIINNAWIINAEGSLHSISSIIKLAENAKLKFSVRLINGEILNLYKGPGLTREEIAKAWSA